MYLRSGNILFLILLAVALFAALSYAVTQSSRSGGNNISEEDARLAASQITQYATLMEQTVSRLRLSNGCRDTQISFAADSDGDGNWYDTDDDYHNPNAPSDLSCHVFHASGGALPPQQPDTAWLDSANDVASTANVFGRYYFNAVSCINNVGVGAAPNCVVESSSGSATELILFVPHLSQSVCLAINERLALDNPSGDAPTNYNDQQVKDNGTLRFNGAFVTAARLHANFNGQRSGCYLRTTGSQIVAYVFYHVLIPR